MTLDNIQIVITNAKCCVGELAAKVAKLYAIGDKCASGELKKLKILIDQIETLSDYYCEYSEFEDEFDLEDGCITEDQANTLAHQIMKQCNICDCQLDYTDEILDNN